MTTLRYMLNETREGIRRNLGAATATVLIIFVSLSVAGAALLAKWSLDDVTRYLEAQVKIKLFIDPAADLGDFAKRVRATGDFREVDVESGQDMLNNMQRFFEGREHLFAAFQTSEIPASVTLEAGPDRNLEDVVASFANMPEVMDVVYPQDFAGSVLSWSRSLDLYGGLTIAILMIAALLTTCVAINLALYQRRQDIRVKLLLGAREVTVRAQFLMEGTLLGVVGGILASFVVYALYRFTSEALEARFAAVFDLDAAQLGQAVVLMVALGSAMGFAGSYFTTRRFIADG